jgi:hypothetical protein
MSLGIRYNTLNQTIQKHYSYAFDSTGFSSLSMINIIAIKINPPFVFSPRMIEQNQYCKIKKNIENSGFTRLKIA